jgi:DNA-binding PadR family transcriptional regulator
MFLALPRNVSYQKMEILAENKMAAEGNKVLVQGSKMLAQDNLRLVALALIAEAPRYGYEVIRLIEEKTAEWYSPTPNIVYPTLTNLKAGGYLTGSTEGPPTLYTITDHGRAYLEQNRDLVDTVLERLTALGERVSRWRRARGPTSNGLEPDSAESLVDILARAADSQRK